MAVSPPPAGRSAAPPAGPPAAPPPAGPPAAPPRQTAADAVAQAQDGPGREAHAVEPGGRALVSHLRPRRSGILAGALLALVGSLLGLAQPLAARKLVDELAHGHPATRSLLLLTVLVVAGAMAAAAGQYLLERTAESVVCTARRRLVDRLLRLRVPELDRREPGDLIARVTSDTTLLRQVATRSLASAGTGALLLLATVAMMALLDPVLLGITLAVVALVGVVVAVAAPRIGTATREAQEAVGAMGAALERTLGAVRTVKASGAEEREIARLHRAAEYARRTGVRAARWQAVSASASAVAAQVAFLVVLGVGAARVAAGDITVSTLVAFLLYLFALAPRIGQLVDGIGQYQVGVAAAVRIGEVVALEAEPAAPGRTPRSGAGPAHLVFDRVGFRYGPDAPPVHHEVSFTAPARATTALVGPSGAGKTTVFSLVERFYEPDCGRILLDGEDVRQWPLGELRAAIGYVEQDAPVLAGTLRENLLLGAPQADEDELRAAVRRARLDTLVARLPGELDAAVGPRGTTLSGGERQRVAIARALLRRPRLLLLDEATSQLDAANEAALRDTLADIACTTTVLVIAHRLSTVTTADRIVVMEAGRVRAAGTHTHLLTADSLYRRLAATQLLMPTD